MRMDADGWKQTDTQTDTQTDRDVFSVYSKAILDKERERHTHTQNMQQKRRRHNCQG